MTDSDLSIEFICPWPTQRHLDFCHAAGDQAPAIHALRPPRRQRPYSRDAALGSAKRDAIQAQINYLEANRQRMNYHL